MFHCDLLPHATSSTSLRPYQVEIEGDQKEYARDFISYVKINNWPRRRGPYLQFFPHFVSFDIPEWMLLYQVDDCEQLSIFPRRKKLNVISLGTDYLETVAKYKIENNVFTNKLFSCFLFFILRGRVLMGGRCSATAMSQYVSNTVHSH